MSQPDADNPEKKGARHNAPDMARLAAIHDKAGEIQQAAKDLGHDPHPETAFMRQKAGELPNGEALPEIAGYVKAAGDFELDILANPYGGPNGGKDSDGEFFSPNTKFHEDKIPYPPIVHYHGYGDDKKPEGLPDFLGMPTKRWVDKLGVWYRAALDPANARTPKMMAAAKAGTLRASTGVVLATHRLNKATGEILSWLNGEISIFDTSTGKRPANGYAVALPALKATYVKAGLTLPDMTETNATPETDATGAASPVAVARSTRPEKSATEKKHMDTEIQDAIAAGIANAMKAQSDAAAVEADRKAKEQERIDMAVKAEAARHEAEMTALKAQLAKDRRLPLGQAPAVAKFGNTSGYDHLSADDLGFAATVLSAAKQQNGRLPGASNNLLQALAIRAAEDKTVMKRHNGDEIQLGEMGRAALKAGGLEPADVLNAQKANELDYSTQAGFGDEWVSVVYSDRLWEAIRFNTFILDKLPSVEVPQGAESIIIPLQGADPTWYKVAQTTDNNATTGIPDATVTASKLATDKATLTVAKLGARTIYSGELEEDSIIPWVSQLRKQLEVSGAETLENVIINGDTVATNSANINAIDTTPNASDVFLVFNGFRKSPLITTTANSRSAGGSLADTDYLATVLLMGAAGKNARDHSKVEFIVDMNTYWKSLQLSNLKSVQSFTNSTLENGELVALWNYKLNASGFMHANSAKLLANSAGKVDADTDSNNTLGAILAVRFDQWLFGYKRRLTIETVRYPQSDSSQIVALTRVGLVQRDTEASAITYNVGV